ncbi:MAG: 2-amino-4-hydroxy-6-hydroxymethyldihydropteridine diphosphokinase [Syntrophothermus sp.]
MKSYTYLLLGSNSGNRELLLLEAVRMISEKIGPVADMSPVYETEPWGFRDEISFLNQVIKVQTELNPESVLHECLSIERILGRVRVEGQKGYASRIIDIDILLYDDLVINEKELVVPHPRMHLRKFTLLPLSDVAAQLVHPLLKKTISQLLSECEDPGKVVLF